MGNHISLMKGDNHLFLKHTRLLKIFKKYQLATLPPCSLFWKSNSKAEPIKFHSFAYNQIERCFESRLFGIYSKIYIRDITNMRHSNTDFQKIDLRIQEYIGVITTYV